MKKIVLAALLAGGLMGADNVTFIGASVGNAELSNNIGDESFDSRVEDIHYTATLGQYIGENARVHLAYTYVEPHSTVKHSDALSLGFDLILPLVENTFSLYVGPLVGYTRLEHESYGTNLDLSGIHYGGQAGAILRVIDNLEIEAGYRYLVETGSDTLLWNTVDADKLEMLYIGANFRF